MSWEEDFLMGENRTTKARLNAIESALREAGVLNHCDPEKGGCGCLYAATLEKCPQCGTAKADLVTPEEPVDYGKLSVDQLKAELKKRQDDYAAAEDEEGLEAVSFTKDDKKADLVAKLEADDAAQVEED